MVAAGKYDVLAPGDTSVETILNYPDAVEQVWGKSYISWPHGSILYILHTKCLIQTHSFAHNNIF